MALTLEMPEVGGEIATSGPFATVESPDAGQAAELVAGAADEDGEGNQDSITVVLLKDVSDPVIGFNATAGQTYSAMVDQDGDTYIPVGFDSNRVYLEAGEFEIFVDQQPVAGGCAEGEGDQPANGERQAEPASTPVAESPVIAALRENLMEYKTENRRSPEAEKEAYEEERHELEKKIADCGLEEIELKDRTKKVKKKREAFLEQLKDLDDEYADYVNEQTTATAAGGCAAANSDQPAETTPQAEPAGMPGAVVAEPSAVEPVDEQAEQDRYRRVLEAAKIGELSLPPKIEEKLVEAGAETVWGLEQLRAEISQGRKEWPKGIGKAKITTIEDELMSWLGRNQEAWAKPAEQHPQPRTQEQIDAINQQLEAQQDAARAADVRESQPPQPEAVEEPAADPLADL